MRGTTPIGERDADRVNLIGQALGATPAHRDEVLVCVHESVTRCTLKVDDFVTIREPLITGKSATVVVSRMRRSGIERIPITSIVYLVTLRLSGSKWVVASKKTMSVS